MPVMPKSDDIQSVSPVAAHVIAKCGGVEALSAWLNISPVQAYKFGYSRERGGTGGRIPDHHQRVLLAGAAERGVDLRPEDFHEQPYGAVPVSGHGATGTGWPA